MIVIDGVEMVDVREAARLSRRTPETIRRWVWTGRLEAIKQGNRLFVPRADVATWPESAPDLDLRGWADLVATTQRSGRADVSAADLILDDRERRAGR